MQQLPFFFPWVSKKMFWDNLKEDRKGWSRLKNLKKKIKTLVLKWRLSTKQLSSGKVGNIWKLVLQTEMINDKCEKVWSALTTCQYILLSYREILLLLSGRELKTWYNSH